MEQVLKMLTETPWPWIVIVLLMLFLFFHKPIERMIDRTQKAKAKASKEGAEFEFESSPEISADPNMVEAMNPIEISKTDSEHVIGVRMKDVLLDNDSEIDEIEGNVDIENLTLDQKSRIGNIKGN